MGKFKDSVFYHEAIHEGITFNWDDHGKKVVEDISYLYDSHSKDLILIANRINSYATKPTDWKKFFQHRYTLKGYAVVSYSNFGNSIALIEKWFIRIEIKRFKSLENSREWVKELSSSRMVS